MTDQELTDAIAKLRNFASEHGMQWVLDEVDDAVALGVPETRTLRQTNRAGRTTYEDVTEPEVRMLTAGSEPRRQGRRDEETGRGRQDFVRSRPMTPREHARLLVQALGRVLTDLDAIADSTLSALNTQSFTENSEVAQGPVFGDYPAPHIDTIRFEPDEGSAAPAIDIDVIRNSDRRALVGGLLREIQAEIEA